MPVHFIQLSVFSQTELQFSGPQKKTRVRNSLKKLMALYGEVSLKSSIFKLNEKLWQKDYLDQTIECLAAFVPDLQSTLI